jgi:WD40 repeat protein
MPLQAARWLPNSASDSPWVDRPDMHETGGHDRTIKLWNAQSGKEQRTLVGHDAQVIRVAFRPDGKCAASPPTTAVSYSPVHGLPPDPRPPGC